MEVSKNILVIDNICPKPYHAASLEGLGGTELTVSVVVQALAKRGHKVCVEMHNATGTTYLDGVIWGPKKTVDGGDWKPEHVIVLRIPEALLEARERFPDAKLYFWCHDMFSPEAAMQTLAAWKVTNPQYLFAVSEYHRAQIRNAFSQLTLPKQGLPEDLRISPKIRAVYPPIAQDLAPDATPYDKNKMCFISSPHKGLDHALDLFKHIRRKLPDLELHITNPGYYETKRTTQEGVKVLGSVGHAEVISLLRSSLCLFFPNTVFPETFGRVYAESEAVGTPVLTHNLGSATEVLSDNREFVDCNDTEAVTTRITEWYNGRRPTVRAKRSFRINRVINAILKELLV